MLLLMEMDIEPIVPSMLLKAMNAERFWDPDSLETLVFNSYVGAAAVFSYEDGSAEMFRVNPKYIREIGMNLTEQEVLARNPWDGFDMESRALYEETIRKASDTGEEQTCETWRTITSKTCGEDRICIRSDLRVIGRSGNQRIVYAMIRNITTEKELIMKLTEDQKKFSAVGDQANIFAWEYTIDTREMRPCSRCMRVLGLPEVLQNYPEPVIASGLFPPDYADMYRKWHQQLEDGVGKLEAIIPLTEDRIPFHVRYTTQYDENGRPLKAFGSAIQVVDEKKD